MSRSIFSGVLVVGLILAIAVPAIAATPVVHSGIDLWATPGDGRTFIDFKLNPIPGGFFCAGSEPFEGRVVFQGAPIKTGVTRELGNADTIVERLDEAAFDKRGVATTRIQVRALSLVGTAPIQTSCGAFTVSASLSGAQPVTQMRIVRQTATGGFYVAPLALNVKMVFTRVDDPSSRPIELKQDVRFNNNPPAAWQMERPEGQTVVHEAYVKVDTDGDGRPDTFLPGTSNFTAGMGAQRKYLSGGCHYYDDGTGTLERHCPGTAIP
jgi:hypothetical protein